MDIENEGNISLNDRIQKLYQSGISKPQTLHTKIALYHEFSLSTVQRKIKLLKETAKLETKQYDNSNRFLLSEDDKRRTLKLLNRDPLISVLDIKHKLKLDCHLNTIRNFILNYGYSFKNIQQIPFQPDSYQKKRDYNSQTIIRIMIWKRYSSQMKPHFGQNVKRKNAGKQMPRNYKFKLRNFLRKCMYLQLQVIKEQQKCTFLKGFQLVNRIKIFFKSASSLKHSFFIQIKILSYFKTRILNIRALLLKNTYNIKNAKLSKTGLQIHQIQTPWKMYGVQ